MPSLLRFLMVIGIIFGIGYAVIFALATMVDPRSREITVTVPPDKFVKPH
jgi:MFS superfamily sulfate permease-like transporter